MTAIKAKILVVEDEAAIAHILSSILTADGYSVTIAENGEQALIAAASHQPDAVLLDLGLPGMDGLEVLSRLRASYEGPVLIVSAREREAEKVEALDLGANDYITKPFGAAELLARICASLRMARRTAGEAAVRYRHGALAIDFALREVTRAGASVHLTQIEYKIIALLAQNHGRVLTYDYIMQQVWGPYLPEDNTILRVNMANIRRKLEENPAAPQHILTEVGVGYRMAEGDEAI